MEYKPIRHLERELRTYFKPEFELNYISTLENTQLGGKCCSGPPTLPSCQGKC